MNAAAARLSCWAALLACACALACAPRAAAPPPRAANAPAPAVPADLDPLRAAAVAAIDRARARAAALPEVAREVSLPSLERMVEDADARRAHVTVPDRDFGFVRRSLETARAWADRLAAGDDPYRGATGMLVKAYRADWDQTLQPYALYVPPAYDARRSWPLVVALHGAYSDHRHNLRRVFGLENRPGETDAEASRNELPLPDVPALVLSPYGRGEFMGYDGLGGEDVMRALADVRRAYNVDPDAITLTGLSMGGGGTWSIGLRHPELFAALAPVCGVTDLRNHIASADRELYDLDLLERMSPPAIAENAFAMHVYIFHGSDDPVVPVGESRRMVERYRQLGWLGDTVFYTEYPGVKHDSWIPAYKDAALLRHLATQVRPRRFKLGLPFKAQELPAGHAVPGLFGKSLPRQRPHIYVFGTHGPPEAVAAARELAERLATWGPGTAARFVVKPDADVTAEDRARFSLVLVGAAPLNALAADVRAPEAAARGDRAFRAVAPDPGGGDRRWLVLGALTPAGFRHLARFAHPNRDNPGPESNFDLLTFDEQGRVDYRGSFPGGGAGAGAGTAAGAPAGAQSHAEKPDPSGRHD
jgi:predicted esterase